MKLLREADKMHPDDPLSRGEYRVGATHFFIACPECGNVSEFYRKTFDGHFVCELARCGHKELVKLTGERA